MRYDDVAMGSGLTRRGFLALPFGGLLLTRPAVAKVTERSVRRYEANIGILFNLLTYTLAGSVTLEIDRLAGTYRVAITGEGPGVTARTESTGIIRDRRFVPTHTESSHTVRGRENRLALSYDYERRVVSYHVVAYTFLLGRQWQLDDVVPLPPGQDVDDLISAVLNFAAGTLAVDSTGAFRVTVVRRARSANEGPDDVSPSGYRAELVTVRFHAAPDVATGRLTALVDLTGFSSWARPAHPAHVVFGPDRYLESARSSLILGTSFRLRLDSGS
jgi:hypothetical protein